ncbi:MAG: NUDIX hydrolase N-terminal domain-containing protein [Chloroflexi bacterium]|nr:NUDIX hydrolase N-terminal domain-containing protein [Chloroflexota bacterium]
MTDITKQLELWVEQIKAIAQTGLAFDGLNNPSTLPASSHVYDCERYEALLKLAATMAASLNGAAVDPVHADAILARWRADIVPGVPGYVTPKVGVGAVVFNDREELLLIQRAEGGWFYPTGWGDIGLSPAAVAVKEVREETGLEVTPTRVIGVHDSAGWKTDLNPHYWSIVFDCRLDGGSLRAHPVETRGAAFFARVSLPEPIYQNRRLQIDRAWDLHRSTTAAAYFDTP